MREIKFRGKRVDKDKWVYWNQFGEYTEPFMGQYESHSHVSEQDVIPDTVVQYTGLKDKNGVEIYEGDILYHHIQGKRKVYYPFNERVASYGLKNLENGMCSTLQDSHAIYEVIGNIHDNLELKEV